MDIHIGTSGFAFPGWRAQVYPYSVKQPQMFDYYCRQFGFDCVEINSSFYTLPTERSMASLARRSPDAFRFMVKAYQAFTHNLSDATQAGFERFHRGIAPLAEAGKLDGILAQFPTTFHPTKRNGRWLLALRDNLAPHPLFVEFRHYLWNHPKISEFLRTHGIGYCITDLPALPPLPRFTPQATNGIAYVRMHGRNPDWYRPTTSRYDYTYTDQDLQDLLTRLSGISPAPTSAYIFFNNCHAGAAVRSGKRLTELARRRTMVTLDVASPSGR